MPVDTYTMFPILVTAIKSALLVGAVEAEKPRNKFEA
jgi:hypothetical protein